MKHIMLDLETFSTRSDACIVSIGAVIFDPNQGVISATEEGQFSANIKFVSSRNCGHIDPNTVMWWLKQSQIARESIACAPSPTMLTSALDDFSYWLRRNGVTKENKREWRVWANDPDFDVTILMNAYRRAGLPYPLSYGGSRSMRTMCALVKELKLYVAPVENVAKHTALADAIYQAHVVTNITQSLRKAVGK